MSGKAAVLDRQLLCKATNKSSERVLCMFPFLALLSLPWRHWWHFSMYLIYAFLSVAPEFPQSIQQYFPDASSVVSSNLAGKFSFYPGPTTVLSLPHISEQNFFSITDCLSEQSIHTWSLGLLFYFFLNYNFFFEFSFFLYWPSSKRDRYLQWAWPYRFMFQILQLPTPCNPQLPSDPLSGEKKSKFWERRKPFPVNNSVFTKAFSWEGWFPVFLSWIFLTWSAGVETEQ